MIKLRKVELTMDEEYKYKIIKKLVETNGNKQRAAIKLDITKRHINRLINKYKKEGKAAFSHKNKGRKPSNAYSEQLKLDITQLYLSQYEGFNFRHFTEKLNDLGISISESFIRNTFEENEILSPLCHRKTKNKINKKLKEKLRKAKSEKAKNKIKEQIITVNDPHPRREKCQYAGEMIQLDASKHLWFGESMTYLHAAIDDATGNIVGAHFEKQETLKGYYEILKQILTKYGIPNMFYTDRRTIFEYRKLETTDLEKDTFTQFSYACEQLGVDIKCTSVSQAKGKVERLFGTLQSRLLNELKLAGVTTIEEANLFLEKYIPIFNEKFALNINSNKSVFENKPSEETINLTLSVLTERLVDPGHCIKYHKSIYKITDAHGTQKCFKKGTRATVIKTLSGDLYANVNSKTYILEKLNEHEKQSRYFDLNQSSSNKKKRYIPPMDHP